MFPTPTEKEVNFILNDFETNFIIGQDLDRSANVFQLSWPDV